MRDLDEFLYKFKNNEKQIPDSFKSVIENFSSLNIERRNLDMKKSFIKRIIIILSSMILGSGVVFAATLNYENIEKIWKKPKTYEIKNDISEEEKKNAISEAEAKEKAINYFNKIGFEKEIKNLNLIKDGWKDDIFWDVGFEGGKMAINTSGEIVSINIPSNQYKIPYNYGITKEEARNVAKELLKKYNPNDNSDEYELVALRRNMENDEESYIWYATFYRKYGELYNKYESIYIGWIPTINGLYSLKINNYKYENNEQIISKEKAIQIAKEKDETIENRYNISSIEAELGIDKMNPELVYREKNIEDYDKGTVNFEFNENGHLKVKDDAEFYKVDDRVRKVWEVTIYYDYVKYEENGNIKYVYFVDCTTGEIIGGDRWSGSNGQIKDLMDDPYNFIEK